jgi:hypothetical protein
MLQKIAFMPGCRPWDTPDPVQSDTGYQFLIPGVSTQVPYAPPDINAGEFSIVKSVKSSVSKVAANASRLFDSNKTIIDQGQTPAWYDLPGKVSQAAASTGEFVQSTLLKVIVLVAIVGVIAIFGMSYVQAKGVSLAK